MIFCNRQRILAHRLVGHPSFASEYQHSDMVVTFDFPALMGESTAGYGIGTSPKNYFEKSKSKSKVLHTLYIFTSKLDLADVYLACVHLLSRRCAAYIRMHTPHIQACITHRRAPRVVQCIGMAVYLIYGCASHVWPCISDGNVSGT